MEGEENRREGAWDVLRQYPEIKQVAKAETKWLQSDARDRMTEILRVQPDIDVLYGHNDPMAIGTYLKDILSGRIINAWLRLRHLI